MWRSLTTKSRPRSWSPRWRRKVFARCGAPQTSASPREGSPSEWTVVPGRPWKSSCWPRMRSSPTSSYIPRAVTWRLVLRVPRHQPRRYFSLPAQLGDVTQLSSVRLCLCPRTPGTRPRCARRGWWRGRSTIPGTRGTHLPQGRGASSTRYTSSGRQLSSFAPLIKNELEAAAGSGVGWSSAISASLSSVART